MLVKATLIVAAIGVVFIICSNLWIYNSTKDLIYESVESVPSKDVGLVLGTSPKLMTGEPNPYFQERINMAATLLKTGKVKLLIVSGDNRTIYYNEPIKMFNALLKKGVPEDKIKIDYAGLRTLDSIVRCKEIFGQDNVMIITQPFHSYRALFISNYYGMDAVSLSVTHIPADFSYQVKVREYVARALTVLDLYIFHRGPKFLGKKENISI